MNAIYAAGLNGEFALEDGTLPWKKVPELQKECKEDMDFFKQMTLGKAVIMGFNTFKTLPFPLKNRLNIVIKRNASPQKIERTDKEFMFFSSIKEALNALDFLCPDDIFLIGGKKLFAEAFSKNLVDGIVYETVFCKNFPNAKIFINRPQKFSLINSRKSGILVFNQYRNLEAPKAQFQSGLQNP
ncbi:dihydrofolate reductase [uncultured Treponema sp.]|uniref:dihydrofolate reductase n=1 Tax=uncultured Treponema sp. TaxID=162155 RepID=UPI0025EAF953|nr:dihydrofolate reductase [uncultured Treponema sp.]